MNYLEYWRFQRSPFLILQYPSDCFVRGSIEEAVARCQFLVNHERRLGILVGPCGGGKSTLLQYLQSLPRRESRRCFVSVDLQGVTPPDLAKRTRDSLMGSAFATDWGLGDVPPGSQCLARVIQEIDDALLAASAVGRHYVLLMDNIGEASEDTVEALAMLLKRPGKWSVILAVDETVLVDLPRKLLEACELKIDLPPWDLALTAEFLEFAFERAGNRQEILTPQAVTRLHELCEGVPRRIVQMADFALVAGAAQQLAAIEVDLIESVFDEFSISLGAKFQLM